MRLVEISMRCLHGKPFAGADSIVEISACANASHSTERRLPKRVIVFRYVMLFRDCLPEWNSHSKTGVNSVQVVSYRRLENHKREPNRTRHGRTVASRYHKHLPCHLLFFLDIFLSFTYPSGMKCFCGCLFLTQSQGLAFFVFWGLFVALLCAIEVFSLGTTFPEYLPSKNRFIIYSIECYLVKDFLI